MVTRVIQTLHLLVTGTNKSFCGVNPELTDPHHLISGSYAETVSFMHFRKDPRFRVCPICAAEAEQIQAIRALNKLNGG